MPRVTKPKIGDIFLIPLPDGTHAYGQYLLDDKRDGRGGVVGLGSLIRVFDLVTTADPPVDEIVKVGERFPPVFVALSHSIRTGRWKIIGNTSTGDVLLPRFKASFQEHAGEHTDWRIIDGDKTTVVGKLSPSEQKLEYWCIWGAELLEKRIATGDHPYREMT
jgi:hypothetical protein